VLNSLVLKVAKNLYVMLKEEWFRATNLTFQRNYLTQEKFVIIQLSWKRYCCSWMVYQNY
jgi:hypothetical protein